MKISNSKKQLAKIIHENGGWCDAEQFYVSTCNGIVVGSKSKPKYTSKYGWVAPGGFIDDRIGMSSYLPNWHQTILSRDEYFYLHPAPDADVAIAASFNPCMDGFDVGGVIAQHTDSLISESNGAQYTPRITAVTTNEQLAADYRNLKDFADRKQQEADAAKADAEAKLAELVAAGKALGLAVSVAEAEPELSINDWQDLQVGDIIECIGNWEREDTDGQQFVVTRIDPRNFLGRPIRIEVPGVPCPGTWGKDFKFIRRPAKGGANA